MFYSLACSTEPKESPNIDFKKVTEETKTSCVLYNNINFGGFMLHLYFKCITDHEFILFLTGCDGRVQQDKSHETGTCVRSFNRSIIKFPFLN